MSKSITLNKAALVGLLILFILGAELQASNIVKPTDDQLLKMIPAESMFCIRVNHFEYTLSQIDQFLAGASPVPIATSMLVRMQLANLFGSPQITGVNMNGSFTLFGVILPGEPTQTNATSNLFVGGFIPVTDYKQFISSNPNCEPPDTKGFSKITKNGNTMMFVTQAGNHALVSWANDYEKMLKYKNLMGIATSASAQTAPLANTIDNTEGILAMTQPVWVYGNVQQASKSFGKKVFEKIDEIKAEVKKNEAKGMSPMMDIDSIANMYIKLFEILMEETKSVSLTLRPKPSALNLKVSISAIPGKDMANMFTADSSSAKQNNLLGYLEDGAMMNVGFKTNSHLMEKINESRFELLEILADQTMDTDETEKIKTLTKDITDSLGGSGAFSFSIDPNNKPPFKIKYILDVKDADKFDKNIEKATEIMTGGIMDFYKNMGIEMSFTMKRGTDSYKGVSIDSAKLVMKSTEPNSPQAQMVNTMFGGGFNYRWGLVNGLWVCAVSNEADSEIRKLIDQAKTGRPQMGNEIKAALALLPEAGKAEFMVTYNYLRLFKIMSAIMPIPMPQMDFQTTSNIVLAGKAENGKMIVDIALPKEHLSEIMKAFQTMQQQKMKMMQQSQGMTPQVSPMR
jgi:hypothetical protein